MELQAEFQTQLALQIVDYHYNSNGGLGSESVEETSQAIGVPLDLVIGVLKVDHEAQVMAHYMESLGKHQAVAA